jgi:hypothetical protein
MTANGPSSATVAIRLRHGYGATGRRRADCNPDSESGFAVPWQALRHAQGGEPGRSTLDLEPVETAADG